MKKETAKKSASATNTVSKRIRNITSWGPYVPRQRAPNEALPPQSNLWERPVYNPARDNR